MEKSFKSSCSLTEAGSKHLLHGVLVITINELKFDSFVSSLWADLNDHRGGCSVVVELPPVEAVQTTAQETHKGKIVWQETLRIYCANTVSALELSMKGHGYHGEAKISAADILKEKHIDGWVKVTSNLQSHGKLQIVLDFLPACEDPLWGAGVGDPESFQGVPNTFFPLHKGCKVTPYQNSHVDDDFCPPISLTGGKKHGPGRYWMELHKAVHDAEHFIYIAGWSMFAQISLVRDSCEGLGDPLEQLLIKRADEGVRVLVMVWDDRTNNLDGLMSKEGLMHTHDEDTNNAFKNTKVKVFRCPRTPKDGEFHVVDGFVFTHHQKAVVLDAPAVHSHDQRRRMVAFVGGIDLCGGRYDTPRHSLFRTLNTVHRNDFHQESLPGANIEQGGPRQPWHDIHSKLEGAVAWDVHANFVQRWEFQGGESLRGYLVRAVADEAIFCPPSPVLEEHASAAWNVQLFRSIDSSSVVFPTDPRTLFEKGLIRENLQIVERSIQDAYICAIRRAKRFIFIENQYFMGSSFAWKDEPGWGPSIPNLIPVEIALKIASKIRAGERFSAYIVIPMAPNGSPPSTTVQDLLHHQRKSMEVMYRIIGDALKEMGRYSESPTDFLAFFCLGNREEKTEGEYVPPKNPPKGSHYEKAQESRRFPIYVHAKVMIVDDEYLIIGSANINQRAMDGGRDSEMAMGAFQPFFTLNNARDIDTPYGDVYAFRMSLWYEHLGVLDRVFDQPWGLECMHRVHELASENWTEYIRPGPARDIKGHLLSYPVNVSEGGEGIYTVPGHESFPDTTAPILGSDRPLLPALLTA